MRSILLLTLALLFSGCQEAPEPKIQYIECDYPRLKTLYKIPPFTPKYVLKDGVVTLTETEMSKASDASLKVRSQVNFYVRQITEYNNRFVK